MILDPDLQAYKSLSGWTKMRIQTERSRERRIHNQQKHFQARIDLIDAALRGEISIRDAHMFLDNSYHVFDAQTAISRLKALWKHAKA